MIRFVRKLFRWPSIQRWIESPSTNDRLAALEADNEDMWEIVNDRWADQTMIVGSLSALWETVQPGSTSEPDDAPP